MFILISAKRVLSLALISKPLSLPTSKPLIPPRTCSWKVPIELFIDLSICLRISDCIKSSSSILLNLESKVNFIVSTLFE